MSSPTRFSNRRRRADAQGARATRNDYAAFVPGAPQRRSSTDLHVEAYGSSVPLKQVATVSTPDARTLQITAFDRSTVGAIRKAIETSDLGLTPNIDGNRTSGCSIPPLNEDRRKDLVKVVPQEGRRGQGRNPQRAAEEHRRDQVAAQRPRNHRGREQARQRARAKIAPTATSKRSMRCPPTKKTKSWRCEVPHDPAVFALLDEPSVRAALRGARSQSAPASLPRFRRWASARSASCASRMPTERSNSWWDTIGTNDALTERPAVTGASRTPAVMVRRVAVGVALGLLGILCAQWKISFALLVLAVAVTSLWELARLVERKDSAIETPVALVAVLLYLILTYFGIIKRYESELLAATLLCALGFGAFNGKGNYMARSGATLLSVLYIGKLTSYFIAIRAIPELGTVLTIFVMTAVALTDTFAMAIGKWIGKTPLSKLSPKKTVECAVAGFAAACATGIAFSFVPELHFTWWEGLFIGALTSAAAQAGDLVESALKRDAMVKDAGSAILGHGGVLDRFDSFLFGGIAFYFALWVVGFAVPGLHGLMHAGRLE